MIAAPPKTIAVIAPICQRVSEKSSRISGASGAKPSVAYEPAAIARLHSATDQAPPVARVPGTRGGSHSSKV